MSSKYFISFDNDGTMPFDIINPQPEEERPIKNTLSSIQRFESSPSLLPIIQRDIYLTYHPPSVSTGRVL